MTTNKKYSFYFLPIERLYEPFILKPKPVPGNYASVMIFIYCFAEIKLIFALSSIHSNVLTFQIWKAMMLICISGLIGISNKIWMIFNNHNSISTQNIDICLCLICMLYLYTNIEINTKTNKATSETGWVC